MPETFSTAVGSIEIKSEAHGPHWVAWIADANGKPRESILLVGETRQEAEDRAKAWAEKRGMG
jgi:hypothetical protein